ncbi:BCCT family transporter [Granulosicoccus antarcticus]|uniref:Glycine betaine transporter BetL n=1 Tax=Granulosicoccus antarcticus IMCC3135 TaxID=1192854 RepID=A0A2Z2P1X3_9GAMM|nr:BCCT family transporter [Granulosicoccus antarcticus]ASJ73624.1 Glycine betaine transporter BetL [Granulosicoccus antarcticus IMCC3135]
MNKNYLTSVSSIVVIVALIAITAIFPVQFEHYLNIIKQSVIGNFGFIFTYPAFLAAIFFIGACFTPLGKIKFGSGDPEFKTVSWLGMLFATGMGIALVTWGVTEPQMHVAAGMSVNEAMLNAYNHWALLAWVGYLAVGVMFSYAIYNMGIEKPAEELLGNGFLSKLNLVSLVVSTVIGLALTFSYASTPIQSSLIGWFGVEINKAVIIGVLALFAIASSTSGLNRGIKWLSNYNSVFALILLFATFVLTQPLEILSTLGRLLPEYLVRFPAMATDIGLGDPERKAWLADWLYAFEASWYGWFIFTGVFIARISKGRTLRQMVLGILIAPSLISCLWFTTFGLAGMSENVEDVFALVAQIDSTGILSIVLTVNILLFFVTSADSAGLVCEMLTVNGSRVLWIVAMAGLAISINLLSSDIYKVILTLISVAAIPVAFGVFALGTAFILRVLRTRKSGIIMAD